MGCTPAALVEYKCGEVERTFYRYAGGQRKLDCAEDSRGIRIEEASFGVNCSGYALGNALEGMRKACDGMPECAYKIWAERADDPKPACAKEFRGSYRCPGSSARKEFVVPADANGQTVKLRCDAAPVKTQMEDLEFTSLPRAETPPEHLLAWAKFKGKKMVHCSSPKRSSDCAVLRYKGNVWWPAWDTVGGDIGLVSLQTQLGRACDTTRVLAGMR